MRFGKAYNFYIVSSMTRLEPCHHIGMFVEVPSYLFNNFHNQLLIISVPRQKQNTAPLLLCCDRLYCDVVSMYIVHISTLSNNNNYKELSFTVKLLNSMLIKYICYKKSSLRNILKVLWGTIMLNVVNNYKLYQLTFFSNTIFWMNLQKNCVDGI